MSGDVNVRGIAKRLQASVAGGVAFCLAFSGLPGEMMTGQPGIPTAEAASSAVIRISDSGPGARRSLKLGLNKAIVVDLPAAE